MSLDNRSWAVSSPDFSLTPQEFFQKAVTEAFASRKIRTFPLVQSYLVNLLMFYMATDNLFDEVNASGKRSRETLAEMYLKASNAEPRMRIELLKKVADGSLYISGFFGDSLQRKVVDVDYYAGMGGTAYATLAECAREDLAAQVYKEIAERFIEFVDVLTCISSQSFAQTEENLLRLYETYSRTGSSLARDRLLEKGLITVPGEGLKKAKQ